MEHIVTSNTKLGIIAGGQLAKMLIQEASKWDIRTYVLDSEKSCPACSIASEYIQGDHLNFEDVYNFGKQVDLLTFEIESVNIEALQKLKDEGLTILPDPDILQLIQDKGTQKEFYKNNQIPTSAFKLAKDEKEIQSLVQSGELSLPFVQKLRTGGYDGRGVQIINTRKDLSNLLHGPSVLEQKVNIKKELAVIIARNANKETAIYPLVEMVFDDKANLVEKLICPAQVDKTIENKVKTIALNIITALNMTGLLAVELFLDDSDHILVNEVAPRTHNSGHHTIESVITSQFEQHLRAILNVPLGSTHLKMPAVMLNLLGAEGYSGPARYHGLTQSMAIEGVKIHVYGKQTTRPDRKMGHVTILGETIEDAIKKADRVKGLITITS